MSRKLHLIERFAWRILPCPLIAGVTLVTYLAGGDGIQVRLGCIIHRIQWFSHWNGMFGISESSFWFIELEITIISKLAPDGDMGSGTWCRTKRLHWDCIHSNVIWLEKKYRYQGEGEEAAGEVSIHAESQLRADSDHSGHRHHRHFPGPRCIRLQSYNCRGITPSIISIASIIFFLYERICMNLSIIRLRQWNSFINRFVIV